MNRLLKFKIELEKSGADAAVISSAVNQRYMTGFDYTDGYVLITKEKSYVLADFRYIEAARAKVDANQYEVVMPEGSMLACISAALDENECKTVLFEDVTLSVADLEGMLNLRDAGSSLDAAYKVLGVSPSATDDEVKAAYRKLALKNHPDRVASLGEDVRKAAEQKFQEINAAMETVKKARGL